MGAFGNILECGVFLFTILLTAIFVLSKCFFLSSHPVGWIMMFANVIYETLFKKFRWKRGSVDAVMLPGLTLLWFLIAGPVWAMVISLILAMAWIVTLRVDQRWRTGRLQRQFPRAPVGQCGRLLERAVGYHRDCEAALR